MKLNWKKFNRLIKIVDIVLRAKAFGETDPFVIFSSNIIFTHGRLSGLIYFTKFLPDELESFAVSGDVLKQLAGISLSGEEDLILKLEEKAVKMRLGNIRLKFARNDIQIPEEYIQNFGKGTEFDSVFLKSLKNAEFSMGGDTRRIALFGLLVRDNNVFACDNMRMFRQSFVNKNAMKEELFFSRPFFELIKSIPCPLIYVTQYNNMIYLIYGEDPKDAEFVLFTPQVEGKFPNYDAVLNKRKEENRISYVEFEDVKEDVSNFLILFSEELKHKGATIKIEPDELNVHAIKDDQTAEIDLTLKIKASASCEFFINEQHFLEGLLRFNKFNVLPESIYFYDDESEYFVMQQTRGNG